MTKIVTSSDLRTNVKQVLNEVEYGAERYIIEKFGQPSAAIISMEDFQFFQAIRAIVEEVERKNEEQLTEELSSEQPEPAGNDSLGQEPKAIPKSMTQQEMVESLMKLLDDSERIPEAAENYMKNNLIGKLLTTLQFLEARVAELQAEVRSVREQSQSVEAPIASGPHSEYWHQFVGAAAEENWERPEQGTVEIREAW